MVLISLLISLYSVLRSNGMQTLLVRLAADYLSGALRTEVRISGLDISFNHGLVIEKISVKDLTGAILFSADELGVRPGMVRISKRKLVVDRVYVEKGIFQLLTHKSDSVLNLQFIIDHFASSDTTTKPPDPNAKPWDLSVGSVNLVNTRFHMQDENAPSAPAGMDYTNLDISNINLKLSDLRFDKDTINVNIDHLSAVDRCGFVLHNLSGEFQVSSAFLKAKNLKIETDNSDLSLSFDFLYPRWGAYNDFLNEVTIRARIQPSLLDLSDIGYFAPELLTMKDQVKLSGEIKGTVSNFKAKNLRFTFGDNTLFYGNVSAFGLPNVEETFVDVNVKALTTTSSDIGAIKLPGTAGSLEMPDLLHQLGLIHLKGTFTGFYNDFVANARVGTEIGSLATDLTLRRQKGNPLLSYHGKLDVTRFDLGKLLNDGAELGPVSLRSAIDGRGFSVEDATLKMNVDIDSIRLHGYTYTNIALIGALDQKRFNGNVNVLDTNLHLSFTGLVDLNDSIPVFDFSATIDRAQLYTLNLFMRDSLEDLSTRIKADFKGTNIDNIDGVITLEDTRYREGNQFITMDRFSLLTSQDTLGGKSYHLRSDFVDADVNGEFAFSAIIPSLSTFIQNYLASFRLHDSLITSLDTSNQVMRYKVTFHKTDEVTKVFLPVIELSPESTLEGVYDEVGGILSATGRAKSLKVAGINFSNWYLDARTTSDNLSVNTGCEHLFLKEMKPPDDSVEVRIDSFALASNLRHDSLYFDFLWHDTVRSSTFGGYLGVDKGGAMNIKLRHCDVALNGHRWVVDTTNLIRIDSNRFQFHNLAFSSHDQYLKVNGSVSSLPQDTLSLYFNKVDISRLDYFLGEIGIDLDGMLNGEAHLSNIYGDISVLSDLWIGSFKFNQELLGDAHCKVGFDAITSRFNVDAEIVYTGNIGKNIPLSAKGDLFLDKKHPRLDLDVTLKSLNLRMVRPFVSSFMSGLNGLVSGQVSIKGNLDRPVIKGQVKLMRTEFKINYLNVMYSLADVVDVDSTGFHFKNLTIYDSLGHKALLNGGITHHHLTNFRLGLHLQLNDFSAFNNTRSQNPIFYGKARGSGTVSITGPIDDINIDVKANTGGNTHVFIPIDLTESVGESDYILFVKPKSDTLLVGERLQSSTNLSLRLALGVKPDAVVEVFFPSQLGNLKASGEGSLLMTMTPTTDFSLSGSYAIAKGSFLFTLRNLLRLPMTIKEGSRIHWAGDPADADISMSAFYKTKAPLKGLTTNPDLEGIRVPVECNIRLGNKLMNPDISFGLSMPTAEESLKTEVFSVIDTNNPQVVTEQTIYLMVMNQFKPVVSTSSGVDVGATGVSLITNQVNSWLSQMTSNVNVNLNYRPGTATTGQEFDVGLSTQFFDDRLLIDGTFGMNSYSNSTIKQSSTIVGDVNISYILTKNRRWRVHAYNRTNTLTILNNNSPYTQGVGVTWQRDFATLRGLFSRSKSPATITDDKKSKP